MMLTTIALIRKPAPPKETRVAPRPEPVVLREWAVGDYAFTLTEEEGEPFPYFLAIASEGLQDRRQGFDSTQDARAYAWHCTEPHKLEFRGLCSPIDSRVLPTIDGTGLEPRERNRVERVRNAAEAKFSDGCPPSELDLVESIGRAAARKELVLVLRERTHAKPPVVKPRHDAGDEAWLAAMSRDFEVSPIKRLVEQRRKTWDAMCMADSGLVGHPA